jgi:predicted RNA-binding Zn-ribbon protein involved in translation (DUF1610 family)
MTIGAYSECENCGFVLEAATASDPKPKRWEVCPDCGERDFEFPE